ncbi:MAG: hypothetical protein RSO15_10485 [Bacteroides sp.]|uniref:hypothetical protein n=1 Tax=Bacteroides sp. TaxID=29523 RepID=UPI002FCA91BD
MPTIEEFLDNTIKDIALLNDEYAANSDWFHESNVSKCLVDYFKSQSYIIEKDNSANIHAHGEDIIVSKNDIIEIIEVKGYPSDRYAIGEKKGQLKKTKPKSQAKHWFAKCLQSTILNYAKHQKDGKVIYVAMAFPDKQVYIDMIDKMKIFFSDCRIGIKVYLIQENTRIIIHDLSSR